MKTVHAKILDETHLELSQPLPATREGRIEIRISDVGGGDEEPGPNTETAVPGQRLRGREDAWCRSHPEILRRYAGQWLVVEGEKVVAHGDDPAQLVKQARAQGVSIPYVFYVDPPRDGVVRLGL